MHRFSRVATSGVAALIIGGLMAQTGAQAQETRPVQRKGSVSIGVLFPSEGDVKDVLGDSLLLVGAGFDFTKTTANTPTILGAYVDYLNKRRSLDVGASRVTVTGTVVGVGASIRHLLTPPTTQTQGYVGIGVGIYNVEGKTTSSNAALAGTEDKTGVGGKLFGGIQANAGFFGEIEYDLFPEIDGDQLGGIALRAGYRF